MSLSKEQLEFRRGGITSTDAAAIVGLSRWKTAGDVWVDKKHPEVAAQIKIDPQVKARLEWGILDEPTIAAKYCKITGDRLYKPGTIKNPQIRWMIATPDWHIEGKDKGVEGKCVETWDTSDWGQAGTDLIPADYLIQIYHQMMTTGFKEWDCAARIGLYRFSIYHFFWDGRLASLLYDAEENFYNKCIKGNERPEFDWGDKLRQYVLGKYPKAERSFDDDPWMLADEPRAQRALLAHREAAITLKRATQEKETQRTVIASLMEDKAKAKWLDEGISISYPNPKKAAKPRIDKDELCEKLLAMVDISGEEKLALIQSCTQEVPQHRVLRIYDPQIREEGKD